MTEEQTPLEQRLQQDFLTITLKPRAIELISRRDMKLLLNGLRQRIVNYSSFQQAINEITEDARKVIYQSVFIAFTAGKNKGALEAHIPYWSIESNDMPTVEGLRGKYYASFAEMFTKLIKELQGLRQDEQFDPASWVRRCDLILQLAVWESYNKGKQALWDDEILKPRQAAIGQAQRYKYEDIFMFQTAADDVVCDLCAPLSGQLSEDFNDLESPPLHAWCRCEIVAIPTVKEVTKQERFLKERHDEQTQLVEP
jgi:hypothetical protein